MLLSVSRPAGRRATGASNNSLHTKNESWLAFERDNTALYMNVSCDYITVRAAGEVRLRRGHRRDGHRRDAEFAALALHLTRQRSWPHLGILVVVGQRGTVARGTESLPLWACV